ncbi:MAG: MFS transporter [Planctomycetes bacterium]|nr:MFS transporter [Planctomycetota bacterium]
MNNASQRRILFAVTLLHGATHLYTIFLSPLNPELQRFFGLENDRGVTFFQTVYLAVYALSNLVAGLLVTRYSPRALLTAGPLLNGLGVLGMSLLGPQHYTGMCLMTALGAAGGGLYHPVANVLLTSTFPHEKGRVLGIAGIGASLAFMIGPYGSGELVHSLGWTWQGVTLLFGSAGIVCSILAFFFVPSGAGHQTDGASPLRPAGSDVEARLRTVLYFAAFAMLVMGAREVVAWGSTNITALFLKNVHGDNSRAGFLLAMIFTPGLVVQPLAGRWSDSIGRERVLFVSMVLLALAAYLIPLTPSEWLIAPYLLFGTAMLATIPTFEALVADRTPVALRGLVFGIIITAGIGIGSVGPYLAGAVADAGGKTPEAYRNVFWVLAALSAGGAAVSLGLKPVACALGLVAKNSEPAEPNVIPLPAADV